ncbi:MFS transporter [candidate division KSB1 bacterium]|nr:MFS transporter [candidate division KSB1 bacterium]
MHALSFLNYFRPVDRPISVSRLQRSMRISIIAGAIGIPWVATFLPGYILNVFFKNHLGGTAFQLGLMVALIYFSNLFHLGAIYIFSRVRSIKLFWWVLHILHRLAGFVLAFVCVRVIRGGDVQTGIVLTMVAITLSFIISNASAAGWSAWMADLVPGPIRATFFTRRTAILNIVSMAWFFLVTLALDISNQNSLVVFAIVFVVAGIGGVVDIFLHLYIPEQKPILVQESPSWRLYSEPLRNTNFRRFSLAFALYMLSTNILAPFLGPYLTASDGIGAPNVWLGILVINIQLATIATIAFWGVVMDRFGRKPVALIGSLSFLAGIGWFFLTPQNYVFIIPVIALLTGSLNPAFIEGINQMMLTITPEKNKTSFVGWFLTIVGMGNAVGALGGGYLYDLLGEWRYELWHGFSIGSFHFVALVNMALCAVSFLFLLHIREGGEKPMGFVFSRLATPGILRTFSNMSIISKPRSSDRVAQALREIEGSSSSLAIWDILGRLDDPDSEVREEAASALGRARADEAVEALIERLCDPESTIRTSAAKALGRIGNPRALPYLIEGLECSSDEVQQACAQAIGKIGGEESLSQLFRLMRENRSERVSALSAEALSRHGVLEAAWEILPMMHHTKNPVLRRQLAIAMGNLLGAPGEFYQYYTGLDSVQGNRFDRLFVQARRTLSAFEKSSDKTAANSLVAELMRVREWIENSEYPCALRALADILRRLVIVRLQRELEDEDALLYYAVYRDSRLGLGYWAAREMLQLTAPDSNQELLRINILLILYFIANYHKDRSSRRIGYRR